MRETRFSIKGFALIEVLIAVTIASIVVISIFSGVSTGTMALSQNANLTRAIIIAHNALSEFKLAKMRGADLLNKEVRGYEGFRLNRETKRYENALLGPLPAQKTTVTVLWQERGRDRSYSLFTIFFEL